MFETGGLNQLTRNTMNRDENPVQQSASSPNEIAPASGFESHVFDWVKIIILGLFLTFAGYSTGCTSLPQRDPYTAAMQREQSLRLMEIGSQLMINSGPRVMGAPPVYAPQNTTCTEFAYGITNCRQW
jgi:hypothetical protein